MAILPPARRVRIESAPGAFPAARVLIDGNDVSNSVIEVTWTAKAGHMHTATVTFVDVEIEADAIMEEPVPPRSITREEWERLREFAPGLVAAIEAARPVSAQSSVVPR